MGGLERTPQAPRAARDAPAEPGRPSIVSTPRGYSRIVSNWNLQPTGVSAFTTLKPDMVS
jgi:hypothetical protein